MIGRDILVAPDVHFSLVMCLELWGDVVGKFIWQAGCTGDGLLLQFGTCSMAAPFKKNIQNNPPHSMEGPGSAPKRKGTITQKSHVEFYKMSPNSDFEIIHDSIDGSVSA